ncbi:MAG: septum formation protein Maf [Flavobacteriales bacterium]|nr:septum formation protein Maf [Flavobacteriales bacterium]
MTFLTKVKSGAINVVLGSKSPRRSELLGSIVSDFEVRIEDCNEIFPSHLQGGEIAIYLSQLKSVAYTKQGANELLITADTIVWMNNEIYEKPKSASDAQRMLAELSGNVHHVYTGVSVRHKGVTHSFVSDTTVEFGSLSKEVIAGYVRKYEPLDKAGAYGIQDCLSENGDQIGPLPIKILVGSYTNVIGLPVEQLKEELSALFLD